MRFFGYSLAKRNWKEFVSKPQNIADGNVIINCIHVLSFNCSSLHISLLLIMWQHDRKVCHVWYQSRPLCAILTQFHLPSVLPSYLISIYHNVIFLFSSRSFKRVSSRRLLQQNSVFIHCLPILVICPLCLSLSQLFAIVYINLLLNKAYIYFLVPILKYRVS
jgi:hypothetical protein